MQTAKERLAALRDRHDRQEAEAKMTQASQRRSEARALCQVAHLPIPTWAEPRPRGGIEMDSYIERHNWAMREREEALKKQHQDFISAEDDFRSQAEWNMILWYKEHGTAFIEYMSEYPCYYNLALWSALGRIAAAWRERGASPLPCPPPPPCGRGDFLASLPPDTKDWGRELDTRLILEDDLTI